MGLLSDTYQALELGHFNWPIRNSHPVHPTTVHFPLTFLSTAYSLDTLYGLTSHFSNVRLFSPLVPYLGQISQIAFLAHVAGTVTAIPSMTSGISEFAELYKRNGINHQDKKLTNPGKSGDEIIDKSINVGMWHGILNTASFVYSGYAVWSRIGKEFWKPTGRQVLISAVMVPAVGLSAALGGELVYGKGLGVQRMGNAKDEKLAGYEEMKAMAKKGQ